MNIALVLAGGVGLRLGSKLPKQFIEVLKKPIMIYTLETFQNNPLIDEIVLVCIDSYKDLAGEYCEKFGINKISSIVSGGEDFIHSCINGMNHLKEHAADDDIVIITSADRPLLTQDEINDCIRVCSEKGSGVSARPCSLCMFETEPDNKKSSKKYMRDNLMYAVTPWAFRFDRIMDSLEKYTMGQLGNCESYPIAIYAAAGNEVYFSLSYPQNIKITESHDIQLFELLLKMRDGK